MGSTSAFNHGSQHAPKRSVTDSNLRVLRRSVRKIINGFRADQVEGILEGIDELRFLTDWNTSSEKNGRKNTHTKNRRYECIGPVSHRKKQRSVTKRDVHNLGDDSLQKPLQFERCYRCRELLGQPEPLERVIDSRPESTLTSKDLVINIYYQNYYYNQLSEASPSKERTEFSRHNDIPRGLTELPGEDLEPNSGGVMLGHSHNFREQAPPTIDKTTKPSERLVERLVRQKKHLGNAETKQFAIGCRICSARAVNHYREIPWCAHGIS
jgi:hypothetical protein